MTNCAEAAFSTYHVVYVREKGSEVVCKGVMPVCREEHVCS